MFFGIDLSFSTFFMILGFSLALYSVVSNDVIQTLGAFISSNSKKPFWLIWAFASVILVITLSWGWWVNGGDLSFGRLASIPEVTQFHWWHALPPLVLLFLTRYGMPVSTTFLVLSVFSSGVVVQKMITKSFMGYIVAFAAAIIVYLLISNAIEKKFINSEIKNVRLWTAFQWIATGFLWSQWIMHDVANIFVYLPRKVEFHTLAIVLVLFVALLGVISFIRGGAIQKVVDSKVNTEDIRSATIIMVIYAFVLMYFKEMSNIPMSTTWVFIGLLAGREVAIQNRIKHSTTKAVAKGVSLDFAKTFAGLTVSVLVVQLIMNVLVDLDIAAILATIGF